MRKFMNNHFGQSRIFGTHVRFAVDPASDADAQGDNGTPSGGGSSTPETDEDLDNDDKDDIEALRIELARAKADVQRFKNSNDKLLKEKGELTKKNRDMMTADQREREAQEERDKRFSEMEKELRTSRYSKRLVGIGMSEADADTFAASIPEMEDADAFFTTLGSFIQAREKSAADKAIQDLLKNRPDIHAGNGDSDKDDPAMALAKAAVAKKQASNYGVNQDILKNFF